MNDLEFRYYILVVAENGGLIEIARTKTGDVAKLIASALRTEFGKQFPNLRIEVEDKHRVYTFADMILGRVEADGGVADG